MPSRLALIHKGNAFKPEISGYRAYFEQRGVSVQVLKRPSLDQLDPFDLEWHFMGTDRLPRRAGRIKVHEYTSSSIPPYARWKNRLKRQYNLRPDLRVFSSGFIQDALGFRDDVPFLFRSAPALASGFFDCTPSLKPEFDLVYLGTLHRSRRAVPMLRRVMDRLPKARLLIINAPCRSYPLHRASPLRRGAAGPSASPLWPQPRAKPFSLPPAGLPQTGRIRGRGLAYP